MSDWRPIETAPKDGTHVLLWEKYEDVPCVAWWYQGWMADQTFVDASGGWDGAMVVSAIEEDFVTHWMPLPEPPEEA